MIKRKDLLAAVLEGRGEKTVSDGVLDVLVMKQK